MAGVSTNGSNDTHYSYKFSGTVVNSATGEPIARALVQIFSQSSPAIFSDSSGHFEFNDLPELQTTVVARKPGFFAEQEIERSPRNSINVHIGPDTPPVTIKLIPEGVIYGKVESNGGPLERIPITLYSSNIAEGRRNWEQRQTVTDDDGGIGSSSILITIEKRPTSTSLSSSANPSVFGQSVIITATVNAADGGTGIPGGTLQFRADGTDFGNPVTLVNGAQECNVFWVVGSSATRPSRKSILPSRG